MILGRFQRHRLVRVLYHEFWDVPFPEVGHQFVFTGNPLMHSQCSSHVLVRDFIGGDETWQREIELQHAKQPRPYEFNIFFVLHENKITDMRDRIGRERCRLV